MKTIILLDSEITLVQYRFLILILEGQAKDVPSIDNVFLRNLEV